MTQNFAILWRQYDVLYRAGTSIFILYSLDNIIYYDFSKFLIVSFSGLFSGTSIFLLVRLLPHYFRLIYILSDNYKSILLLKLIDFVLNKDIKYQVPFLRGSETWDFILGRIPDLRQEFCKIEVRHILFQKIDFMIF